MFVPVCCSLIELLLTIPFIAVESVDLIAWCQKFVVWTFTPVFIKLRDNLRAELLPVVCVFLTILQLFGFFDFIEGDGIEAYPALEEILRLDTLVAHVSCIDCSPVLFAPFTLVRAPEVTHESRQFIFLNQAIGIAIVLGPERDHSIVESDLVLLISFE